MFFGKLYEGRCQLGRGGKKQKELTDEQKQEIKEACFTMRNRQHISGHWPIKLAGGCKQQ